MTQHTNTRAAGQVPATDKQQTFLRSLVGELGARGAAKRVGANQLSVLRALTGLPVLRGTLALVDAARSSAKKEAAHAA